MTPSVLLCLAPDSEETEAVTTFDLLVRADIAATVASVVALLNKHILCCIPNEAADLSKVKSCS